METNTASLVQANKGKVFLNTLLWGLGLWLFGYALGFIFFFFVPKELIGWFILPFGVFATLWVLFKKIHRESFGCYIALGIIWTILAVGLDYVSIVKMLNSPDYYKPDVYAYYALTFLLPVFVGWRKKGMEK